MPPRPSAGSNPCRCAARRRDGADRLRRRARTHSDRAAARPLPDPPAPRQCGTRRAGKCARTPQGRRSRCRKPKAAQATRSGRRTGQRRAAPRRGAGLPTPPSPPGPIRCKAKWRRCDRCRSPSTQAGLPLLVHDPDRRALPMPGTDRLTVRSKRGQDATVRESVSDRQERILAVLRQRGMMRVADLAREMAVSAVTARRDVEALARQGALRRSHGLAIAANAASGWADSPMEPLVGRGLAAGRDLRSLPDPVIGMVVPTAPYYYSDVIRGARAAVAEANGRLIVGITNYDLVEERAQIRQMQARGVNALLLTPAWPTGTSPEEEADRAAGLSVPTVLVERRGRLGVAVGELDRVCSAHASGSYLAVRHLVGLGRQRITLIARGSPTAAQLEL